MYTVYSNEKQKTLFKKAVSFLIVLCMMISAILPLTAVTASAAAPTSYTTITTNSTASVSITSSGSAQYFKFVPTASGTYKFYSTNYTSDPYGALLDASGNTLTTNDDGGTDYNFSITYDCTANTTYYIKAYLYSSSSTGSYTLNVQTVSIDCECSYTLQSTTTADCENDGVETYVCSLCGNSYTNTVATALGHNYVNGTCTRCSAEEYTPIIEYNATTGDVFLGGQYIELGISRHGSFGTSTSPQTEGFHSNGALGMIVDDDGWDVGNAPTTGDFFLPDTPEERYIFSYYYNGIKYEYIVADRRNCYTGTWTVEPTVTNQSAGKTLKAVVYGVTQHNIGLEITYSFGVSDKNFKTSVKITNDSSLDITNVRFVRSFDPDQDDDIYNTNNTYNKVLCNPDRTQVASDTNYAMVVARGARTLEGFFFLAFDNRAFASQDVSFAPESAYLSGLWAESHSYPNYATEEIVAMTSSNTNGYSLKDTGIAITFSLDTIAASGEDSLIFYSSLSPSVDEELNKIIMPTEPTIHSISGAQITHDCITAGPYIEASVADQHIISYQWYINDDNSNIGGTAILGATASSYAVPNRYADGTMEYYYCVVTATRTDNHLSVSLTSQPVIVEYCIDAHTYTEVSRTEASCTTYGEIVYICSCGATRSELIEPTNHNYQITDTVEPTCTTDGYIAFACQNTGCEATKRQTLERLGHNYAGDNICDRCGHTIEIHTHDYEINIVEPTCTAMGYTEYTCSCGYSYRDNYLEPIRHDWNDGQITIIATCTTDGLMTYTCEVCGATKTTIIAAAHQWSEVVTVGKTCTTDGSMTKTCTVCGEIVTEIIPAEHNWDTGVVTLEPTCETEGSKICACEVCGDTQVLDIPALGHTYVNGVCTRCGEKFIDNITPSTHPVYGMYFEIDDILSDYGPSLIDEYGLMLDYNSDANLEKVAVYLTQDGTMWRRCIAVKGTNITYATYVPYLSYQSDIKYTGLNHDWINIFRLSENSAGIWCYNNYATIGVNLEDAYGNLLLSLYDIGQAGAQTRIFDDLDEMIAWLTDECINHTPGEWIVDVPASCVSGSQHKECTACGKTIESEAIPPVADHISSEWIVDVAPTATQTGSRHKECTVCGAVLETEIMPILAKLVIENVEAKAGKTVRVTIDIQNNPGIIGALLTIEYDPALTLIDAEAGSAWNTLNFTSPNTFSNPCNFVWDGVSGADFSNGSIIVLTFEIPVGVDVGTIYNISAYYTYGNMINENLEAVDLEIENGSITIVNTVGDVNDDGVVDIADVIVLRRYLAGDHEVVIDEFAADMDNDGYITVADVVLLRRFLVG